MDFNRDTKTVLSGGFSIHGRKLLKKKNNCIRFSVRFNLNNPKDAKPWGKLSSIEAGRKSEYCIDAILNMHVKKNKCHKRINDIQKINEAIQKIHYLTTKDKDNI